MVVIPIAFRPVLDMASRLKALPMFALLDSALPNGEFGRHAFLAAEPFGRLRVIGGHCFWNDEEIVAAEGDSRSPGRRALAELDARLKLYRSEPLQGLPPFQGGAAGYVSYEFGRLLERLPGAPEPVDGVADLDMAFYDVVVALDVVDRKAFVLSTGWPETDPAKREWRARDRADRFLALIEADAAEETPFAGIADPVVTSTLDAAAYERAVARTRDYILDGDIFQANIARRVEVALAGDVDAFGYYRALRGVSPAPFSAWLDFGEVKIASSSPERLLSVRGGAVETRPIKGTARRSDDAAEDARLADALAASDKDRAENVMIVDLLRSDLSAVCRPGSVHVPRLNAVESYAGLHHLVSTVTGELAEGRTAVDALAAVFPGGSITGAPKIRAMEIIAELERAPRGVYCGAIGYLGFDGSADFNIAIRTVTFAGGKASLGAGSGITMLSDPAAEEAEARLKAARMLAAFGRPA